MQQYRDEGQAVARAINAGEGSPTTAKWQDLYTAGYRESAATDCDTLIGIDRLLADSMTHALLRRTLAHDQYSVLVLRYSGDEAARVSALKALMPYVGTNSGQSSRALSIGAWASKAYQQPARDWDQQGVSERTLQAWRQEIRRALDKLHGEAMTAARTSLEGAGLIEANGA